MNESLAIEVEGLRKTYSDGLIFRKRFEALKGVSFHVRRGEIFGLLGPNGAGKTTFVKILLGIIRKSSGDGQMLGRPLGDRLGRLRVGYLPEHLRVPRHHNAFSALRFFGKLSGMTSHEVKQRQGQLLEMVGLASRAKDGVAKYSKGMLQRLGLAQSLLHDPDLLFLDEPTDGLDPVGRSDVRQLIQQLRDQGKTVFLNSHLLQEVEMVCDRVAIMHQGELKSIGTVDEVAPQRETGFELTIELAGSMDAIDKALSGRIWVATDSSDRQTVTFEVKDQAEVDQLVDRVRAQGVSIIAISRKRLSLEDVFLKIVGGAISK